MVVVHLKKVVSEVKIHIIINKKKMLYVNKTGMRDSWKCLVNIYQQVRIF